MPPPPPLLPQLLLLLLLLLLPQLLLLLHYLRRLRSLLRHAVLAHGVCQAVQLGPWKSDPALAPRDSSLLPPQPLQPPQPLLLLLHLLLLSLLTTNPHLVSGLHLW
jgi:hypothetical protein